LFPGVHRYVSLVAGATLTAAHALRSGQADVAICWDGGRYGLELIVATECSPKFLLQAPCSQISCFRVLLCRGLCSCHSLVEESTQDSP
jgi:hypothetical protein